jgi:hypothetical protein
VNWARASAQQIAATATICARAPRVERARFVPPLSLAVSAQVRNRGVNDPAPGARLRPRARPRRRSRLGSACQMFDVDMGRHLCQIVDRRAACLRARNDADFKRSEPRRASCEPSECKDSFIPHAETHSRRTPDAPTGDSAGAMARVKATLAALGASRP